MENCIGSDDSVDDDDDVVAVIVTIALYSIMITL